MSDDEGHSDDGDDDDANADGMLVWLLRSWDSTRGIRLRGAWVVHSDVSPSERGPELGRSAMVHPGQQK